MDIHQHVLEVVTLKNLKENKTEFYEKRSNKTKATCLTKYGVDNVSKNEQIKIKQKQTMITKYNVEHNSYNQETLDKRSKTFFNKYWETFVLILKNKNIDVSFSKDDYCSHDGIYEFKCNYCNSSFSRSIESKYKLRPQNIYCGCQSKGTSVKEKQLFDLISYETKIPNKRFSKDGKIYELDIYLPEINLGIEFNGMYWHSEVFKDSDYHKNKSDWFKQNYNIDIIHVFENDFDNKLDIVLSIINNRIGNNLIKIPARKCIKKEISAKEYKTFLDINHIQGSINSKIKKGLFYNNELVSVIGIGKSRFDKTDELHRFCNKLNYSIIGGFSKLMKGFSNITTYCDRNYFNGNGYKTIGFIEEYKTKPNYKYYKKSIILSRYQCQKHKLNLMLDKFDLALTEHENMLNNGWIRIYDCGNIKLKI